MSSKITIFMLLQLLATIAFIILLYGIFSPKKVVIVGDKSISKNNIWKSFSPKIIVAMLIASAGLTWILSSLASGLISRIVIFGTLFSLAPYFVLNNANRITKERIFKDIILYCSNTAILLKQNYTVPDALASVVRDLGPELANDIDVLRESFKGDKYGTKVKEVMAIIEEKYPYTCINNMNIILLIRHFDASKDTMPDSLYDTFIDDIAKLEQDINLNKQERNKMRMMYMGLTAGGIFMYMYFYNDMTKRLGDIYNTPGFHIANLIYIFLSILALFFVDRFFNGNTSKE